MIMKNEKGKLVVLYGINNLGKTTQAKLLVQRMQQNGIRAKYVKYAHYELESSGPLINEYIRSGNPEELTAREFQILQVLNRTQYQNELINYLAQGMTIVAEDYIGTGIAWGVGAGISKNFLVRLNIHLIKEDIAFHFVGKRFTDSIEKGHSHETNSELTERVRIIHEELAKENKWIEVDNKGKNITQVSDFIWEHFTNYTK